MSTKVVSGFLLASGLLASGIASAQPVLCNTTTTIGGWRGGSVICRPGTPDSTTFTLDSTTFEDPTQAHFTESLESSGIDLLNVDFSHNSDIRLRPTDGQVSYTVSTISPRGLNLAALDTQELGAGGTVTKDIFTAPGGTLLQHFDIPPGGGRLPPTNYFSFPNQSSVFVVDTINGSLESITNELVATRVPEPMSLSLFGIGLAAFRFIRRRTA